MRGYLILFAAYLIVYVATGGFGLSGPRALVVAAAIGVLIGLLAPVVDRAVKR